MTCSVIMRLYLLNRYKYNRILGIVRSIIMRYPVKISFNLFHSFKKSCYLSLRFCRVQSVCGGYNCFANITVVFSYCVFPHSNLVHFSFLVDPRSSLPHLSVPWHGSGRIHTGEMNLWPRTGILASPHKCLYLLVSDIRESLIVLCHQKFWPVLQLERGLANSLYD